MKHIKRIFELNENKLSDEQVMDLGEYIEVCFVEYIDAGASVEYEEDDDIYRIDIELPSDRQVNRSDRSWDSKNISRFIESTKIISEVSQEIEHCIDRVLQQYPNIDYTIVLQSDNSVHDMKFSVIFFYGVHDRGY